MDRCRFTAIWLVGFFYFILAVGYIKRNVQVKWNKFFPFASWDPPNIRRILRCDSWRFSPWEVCYCVLLMKRHRMRCLYPLYAIFPSRFFSSDPPNRGIFGWWRSCSCDPLFHLQRGNQSWLPSHWLIGAGGWAGQKSTLLSIYLSNLSRGQLRPPSFFFAPLICSLATVQSRQAFDDWWSSGRKTKKNKKVDMISDASKWAPQHTHSIIIIIIMIIGHM